MSENIKAKEDRVKEMFSEQLFKKMKTIKGAKGYKAVEKDALDVSVGHFLADN
jgi:hypothetical protein